MKTVVGKVRFALFVAGLTLLGQTATAQSLRKAEGWPGTGTPSAASALSGPPAVRRSTPAGRPAPAPAIHSAISSDLVVVLQQQSAILARLASELEAQRQVVENQRLAILDLQKRPLPVAAPAAAPLPSTRELPPPPPPITVDTGGAKLRMSGLVQAWFAGGSTGSAGTFRLRRTELKLSGDLNARARWTMVIDAAKSLSVSNTFVTVGGQKVVGDTAVNQSGRVLQDAFISLTASPAVIVEVGQQKLPLSLEGTQSSSRLDTVERALFITDKSRGAGYGDIRDLGALVRGKALAGQIEYTGGVFNGLGESMNDVDRNSQKAFAARVVIRPRALKGLQAGGSMARGSFSANPDTRRERQGLEVLFARGRFGTKAELMAGRDTLVPRLGYYAQASARVSRSFETIFRTDVWDPDTRSEATAATVTERDWIGGMNWQVAGPNVLLQVEYLWKTFGAIQPARRAVLANVQTTW